VKRRVAALAVLLAAVAACSDDRGATQIGRFTIDSRLVHRRLEEVTVTPPKAGHGRPLLVLLHGRGAPPDMFLYPEFLHGLERLRKRAPVVLLANGSDSSYFHDRRDGRWGSYLLEEAIPAAVERLHADPRRVAIGGISMGGWGALALALEHRSRFCAVGGHSPAMWFTAADTPFGAFDDREDFARHDLVEAARLRRHAFGRTKVWVDVGRDDPFVLADAALVTELRETGQPVAFHIWPGSHSMDYWRAHTAAYLRFYADALAAC
jgi:S-formylglutathione hydrolase FrmB